MRKIVNLAAIIAAIALVIGALFGFNRASAQDTTVGRGQTSTTIRGSLVLIADGLLAVTVDDNIVLIENVGVDGANVGAMETLGKVPGDFMSASVAGDVLVAIDRQKKVWYINWRSDDAPVPVQPPPGKGGGVVIADRVYFPFTSKPVGVEPPYPPAPTDWPTEEPMPPPPGPTIPPAPLDPTPPPCGYPPCNMAEALLLGR